MISDMRRKAIVFATQRHKAQLDKGGVPYITHPFAVASAVGHLGDDYFITGILHDVVEDTNTTLDDVERIFGKTIRDAVDSLTRRGPKSIGLRGAYPQQEKYVDFLQRSKANPIGQMVKIEDIKDNSRPHRVAQLPEDERGIVNRYRKALLELETPSSGMKLA